MAAARTGESVCQSGGCVGSVGRAFAHTRCLRACFRRWSFVVEPARPSRTARSDVGSGTHLRRQLPSAPCAAVAGRVASRLESPSPTGHCFWLGVEPQRTQNGRTLRPVQSGPNQNSRHQNGCNYASDKSRTTARTILHGYPLESSYPGDARGRIGYCDVAAEPPCNDHLARTCRMTTSEWLQLAYFPCLFVALSMLAYVGLKYSQGKQLTRRKQRRVLLVGAIALAVGVVLYAPSWFV